MKFVHKAYGAACAAFVALAPAVQAGNPVCENDQCLDGRPVNRHASEQAAHAVTEPRPGEFRFELRPGDQWSVDRNAGTTRERAELSLDETPVRFDVRYRVSYDLLIAGDAPVTSEWLVAGQWHATEDKGDAPSSPPLAFELSGRDLVLYTQSETQRRHRKNPKSIERARVKHIARDRWIHISYDVRFNPRHGALLARVDGRTVFSGDIPIGYADDVGPYFVFGIYRAKTDQTLVLRYRNLSIRELPR